MTFIERDAGHGHAPVADTAEYNARLKFDCLAAPTGRLLERFAAQLIFFQDYFFNPVLSGDFNGALQEGEAALLAFSGIRGEGSVVLEDFEDLLTAGITFVRQFSLALRVEAQLLGVDHRVAIPQLAKFL